MVTLVKFGELLFSAVNFTLSSVHTSVTSRPIYLDSNQDHPHFTTEVRQDVTAYVAPMLRLCCAYVALMLRLCCAYVALMLRLCSMCVCVCQARAVTPSITSVTRTHLTPTPFHKLCTR